MRAKSVEKLSTHGSHSGSRRSDARNNPYHQAQQQSTSSPSSSTIRLAASTSLDRISNAHWLNSVEYQVSIQSKVNELFLRWLSSNETQNNLKQAIVQIKQTGQLGVIEKTAISAKHYLRITGSKTQIFIFTSIAQSNLKYRITLVLINK
ncbi:hypothetical protein GJ496_001818 [Pomphorhynchus laevis]|nr:hypothetical protein GJ496_001818 [Pomphorhynchus laevis]